MFCSYHVLNHTTLLPPDITYSGDFDLTSMKYIDLEPHEEEKYLVKRNDLLFNRTNSKELVGKCAVYNFDEPRAIAGYLIRVRSNERSNTNYISGFLNSNHGKQILQHMCKNIVGMANINAQEMQNIKIFMPPIDLQNKYSDIVKKIFSQKAELVNSQKEIMVLSNSLNFRIM